MIIFLLVLLIAYESNAGWEENSSDLNITIFVSKIRKIFKYVGPKHRILVIVLNGFGIHYDILYDKWVSALSFIYRS